jgi:hypothetical protein
LEEKREFNFEELEFREVEPTLREMKQARSSHKIILYPRRIYINKALEELNLKPKYVRFFIDEVNKWVALKFDEAMDPKNLPVHYSNTARTYVSTPITIAESVKPIMSRRRDGSTQPTYIPYYYHNGMILFSYEKEEAKA